MNNFAAVHSINSISETVRIRTHVHIDIFLRMTDTILTFPPGTFCVRKNVCRLFVLYIFPQLLPISIKFGVMTEDLPGDILDTTKPKIL
jgi:hypothetical protein